MKVAISGAGVAGPSLAFWLLRAGHDITLIEKAPAFRTGGYLVDFWGLGYTVAERMGILPAVREAGYPVQEVRPVDGRGRKAGGFSADVFRRITGDRFTSLPRGDLAAIIYRTVEPSVETLFATSITALEQHSRGVAVTLDSGSERAFDLVIGADGLHSRVRELAFGPEARFERQLGYRVAAFEVDGYRPRDELVYVGYNSPGRQIARFALRGGRTMFMFVFLTEHLRGPDPTDLAERKATIRRVFGNEGWECPGSSRRWTARARSTTTG